MPLSTVPDPASGSWPAAEEGPGEAGLLLACARLAPDEAARRRVDRALEAGPDWARLLDLAQRHRLGPLLYRNLAAPAPAGMPKQVFVELWARQAWLARRNQALAAELLRILARLEGQGIRAVPFKGPVLAVAALGDLALREFGDLDLLLRRDQVLRARDLLAADGYRALTPLRPQDEAAFLRAGRQYDLEMLHEASGLRVELHWRTSAEHPVERLEDAAWWEGLEEVVVEGVPLRTLPRRELLLALLLHGTKHHWSRLAWLVDVAELLRQEPGPDWPWLLAAAERLGCRRRVAAGLALAQGLLGAPLPAGVQAWLDGTPRLRDLAARLQAPLFAAEAPAGDALRSLRLDLALDDTPGQRLRRLGLLLLTPNAEAWGGRTLPRGLGFLHLPARLLGLAWKHARRS